MDPIRFDATREIPDWNGVRETLLEAFEVTQSAAKYGRSVVYLVHQDDLLGRRGSLRAMVAMGLLSAARTAAIELSREGVSVNVLAVVDDTPVETIDRWVDCLGGAGGPTGELIRFHPDHLGKALP